MQELRQGMSSRDQIARPSADKSITGHQIGRDTVTMGDFKREFKDRNDMLSHMKEQTKQRASRTPAARGDDQETSSDRQYPNAGHTVSRPAEVLAKQARGQQYAARSTEPRPMSDHEKQILGTSVAGHKLGQDTIHLGDQYRNFRNRDEMMSQLNTQTSLRASHTEGAQGGEEQGGAHAFPNAGHSTTSDPSKLTDKARKGLAALGFVAAAKRQASSDIEDKER